MRSFSRLLASVKPARYLEPNTPTGLTGLATHPAPRSALIYLYVTTLDRLKRLPEASVYKQSVEALTRHRLNIVERIKPAGYDAWLERSRKQLADHPELFEKHSTGGHDPQEQSLVVERDGHTFVTVDLDRSDVTKLEWDGEEDVGPVQEGTRSEEERAEDLEHLFGQGPRRIVKHVKWEPEPQLNADRIQEVENEIGAGLIEEVIQVAEGELKLVDIMAEAKAWEELVEKPPEGQWEYFERGSFMAKTQSP